MFEKIRDFLYMPKKTGIMFLVLAFVFLLNVGDVFADTTNPLPYDRNWVNGSIKSWTGLYDSAFSYYYRVDVENPVISERYEYVCSGPSIVVARYNTTQDTYSAVAISLKDQNTNSGMMTGHARFENEVTLVDNAVNNYNMTNLFPDWYTYFPEWNNSDYWVTTVYTTLGINSDRYASLKYDLVANSAQDLRQFLENSNWNPSGSGAGRRDPYFYLKVTSPALVQNVEYTITWDTEGSYVEDDISDYGIEVYLSQTDNNTGFGNMNFQGKKAIKQTDMIPFGLNRVAFSFSFNDLMDLVKWDNGNWLENSFYIWVRVVYSDGSGPVNNHWVNWHIARIYEITSSKAYEETGEGTVGEGTPLTTNEDGVMDYDDGRPTGDNTNQDGEQNSNGSSVSPDASEEGINNYDPTNPDNANFSYGGSIKSLFQNLQELVSGIQGIPSILASVLSFLPSWLLTLIAVSIGLFVVVGTIKLILR